MARGKSPVGGRTEITLPNNWRPRDYQQAAWDAARAGKLRHSLAWHRRAGKDDFALNRTAVGMMQRVGTYWHMLPQANQARKAIWDAVDERTGIRRIDQAFPVELREVTREHEMFIRFKNGSTWQVVGSDNYNALVGSPPVGVVFSEYALADPAAWSFLRPIMANNGGWAMFISTPRGQNHFAKLHRYAMGDSEWFAQTLGVDVTGAISPEVIDRERRELSAERGEAEARAIVEQEYYCFPPGTCIWTDCGQKPIENISVGDIVLTHTGRWRPVKRLYEHEHDGEMVSLSITGIPKPLVCTPNHPVRVADTSGQTFKWVPAGEVNEGDYVVLPRVKTAKPAVSVELAEAVAWYIAEGSLSKTAVQVTLGSHELEFSERVKSCFSVFGAVSARLDRTVIQCQVKSTAAADFMLANCGSGAANKRIPWDIIRGHERLVYDTLVDGDGCRGNYSGVDVVYTTVSETLAHDFQMLAHVLGFRASISRRDGGESEINGRKVMTRASYQVRVNEKKAVGSTQRIKPMKNGVAARVRKVAREEYVGPVYNFGVAYDESYVAGGVTVHNCSFDAALPGSYFGEIITRMEKEERVGLFPWDPRFPVGWGSDLGMKDSTTFWFWQDIGGRPRLINFFEGSGVDDVGWYANKLNSLPYTYGRGLLPHDGGHRRLGMAGSISDQMRRFGCRNEVIPVTKDLVASINHTRLFLANAVINTEPEKFPGETQDEANARMARALQGLRMYRREWNEAAQRFNDKPYHDWCSNIADGLRTVAVGHRPMKEPGRPGQGRREARYAEGV